MRKHSSMFITTNTVLFLQAKNPRELFFELRQDREFLVPTIAKMPRRVDHPSPDCGRLRQRLSALRSHGLEGVGMDYELSHRFTFPTQPDLVSPLYPKIRGFFIHKGGQVWIMDICYNLSI